MWPYGGKKTFVSGYNGSMDHPGIDPTFKNPNNGSGLDKEYFHQLTFSVGMACFSGHTLANDGRVLRQYGVGMKDVTDEFCSDERHRFKTKRHNTAPPQKQLHQRNVDNLKIVLSLPDKKRKTSLTHIAGAIMRNEVAPSLTHLQNDEFLNEHLARATDMELQNGKLPPLSGLNRTAGKMGHFPNPRMNRTRSNNAHWGVHPGRAAQGTFGFNPIEEVTDDVLFLGKVGRSLNNTEVTNEQHSYKVRHSDTNLEDSMAYGIDRRMSPPSNMYMPTRRNSRMDSAARTSQEISQQFRAIVKSQMLKNEESRQLTITRENSGNTIVGGCYGEDTIKKIPKEKSKNTNIGYKLRHEYGKNLEKNWFKQFMQKNKKDNKVTAPAQTDNPYDMRFEMFYSPEPQSDEEFNGEATDDAIIDESSIQCGGFSTATAEDRSRLRRHIGRKQSQLFTQQETVEEQDETDDGTSGSDIEIIFKDDQLIQRKTKHKLRKKRQRQHERYKAFLPPDIETGGKPSHEEASLALTDQEIRAIRLNLRNKERLKKLRGKRKFLQVANAVYIAIQFKNILQRIRKRKRKLIKQRQQKIAAMVAKRTALKQKEEQEKDAEDDDDEMESIISTPKPSLRDIFMKEIGQKLIYDISRLDIRGRQGSEPVEQQDPYLQSCMYESEENIGDAMAGRKRSTQRISMYGLEMENVSTRDIDNANFRKRRNVPRRKHKRRHSIPKLMRKPNEFRIEVPVKTKRRRDASKSVNRGSFSRNVKEARRTVSPQQPKCSCFRHRPQPVVSAYNSRMTKCHHQPEVKKQKMKIISIPTSGLMRTNSLQDLTNKKPIELKDLLHDIDFPAKDIKLQILARKFKRQKRKRQQIRLSPCRLPGTDDQPVQRSESDSVSDETDESESSDYDFAGYGSPFVGSGVMWNQNSRNAKKSWTAEDVDREVKKITRIFHEMKECRYLRLDGFNDAIMQRLNEKK